MIGMETAQVQVSVGINFTVNDKPAIPSFKQIGLDRAERYLLTATYLRSRCGVYHTAEELLAYWREKYPTIDTPASYVKSTIDKLIKNHADEFHIIEEGKVRKIRYESRAMRRERELANIEASIVETSALCERLRSELRAAEQKLATLESVAKAAKGFAK